MKPTSPDAVETNIAPSTVPETAPVKVPKKSFIDKLRGLLSFLKRKKAAPENVEASILMPGPAPTLPPEQHVAPPTPEELVAQVAGLTEADKKSESANQTPLQPVQSPVETEEKKAA